MLLALYDEAIQRLERALTTIRNTGDSPVKDINHCRLLVGALAAGINPAHFEVASNFQRLYEFVLYSLGSGGVDNLESALRVLCTMREGFQEARAEAVRLERAGEIPALDASSTVQALA